jgi:hypothetical protein
MNRSLKRIERKNHKMLTTEIALLFLLLIAQLIPEGVISP